MNPTNGHAAGNGDDDGYPAGNEAMGPNASLEGRRLGQVAIDGCPGEPGVDDALRDVPPDPDDEQGRRPNHRQRLPGEIGTASPGNPRPERIGE